MNTHDRIQLEKMIQANDAEDNTAQIRDLKHSAFIHQDVGTLLNLKRDYARLAKTNPDQFDMMCVNRCTFLFNNYTDIFNKVKKDEIDLNILLRLINILHAIEEGALDQHEGSFEVGKLLKEIYIDSALRKADKLNEDGEEKVEVKPAENISWREFKLSNNTP